MTADLATLPGRGLGPVPGPVIRIGLRADLAIRPFEVHVPDDDLTDFRQRIAATRWPLTDTERAFRPLR